MRTLAITLMILVLAVGVALGDHPPLNVAHPPLVTGSGDPPSVIWFDDLEPVAHPGWTHGSYVVPGPHFHVDTYLACSGDFSWWCGTFAYDANGGYGNQWEDWLNVPPTGWSGYTHPILSFCYRNHTEPAYDFTYVQAQSLGVWVNLNRGYDGFHPCTETGFYIGNMDDPAICRFLFVSDCGWSDEDGLCRTDGGAFHCDDIAIWDYFTSEEYLFYDDVEAGGLCTPGPETWARDYWHIIENDCKAWSDPHVWVNTRQPAEDYVPPNVKNWLRTPEVDITAAPACTIWFIFQYFTPTVDCDYWTETVHMDGVPTQVHAFWGDQCDQGYGPCDHFLGVTDISAFLPAQMAQYEWAYYSTDNGAGPDDVCGSAGLSIDNIGFSCVQEPSAVERTSWGSIKALYR